jgi:hypothetical protein
MVDNTLIYHEKLSSYRTSALFLALTLLFGVLFAWQVATASFDALAVLLLCLAVIFLFYTLNYRTLVIQIAPQSLMLKFGVISWTERIEDIESCVIDEMPWLLKYGGAGVHFMTVRKRYRASFNFLEYPRVVVALKRKRVLVRDISFSTRQPEQIIQLIHK